MFDRAHNKQPISFIKSMYTFFFTFFKILHSLSKPITSFFQFMIIIITFLCSCYYGKFVAQPFPAPHGDTNHGDRIIKQSSYFTCLIWVATFKNSEVCQNEIKLDESGEKYTSIKTRTMRYLLHTFFSFLFHIGSPSSFHFILHPPLTLPFPRQLYKQKKSGPTDFMMARIPELFWVTLCA